MKIIRGTLKLALVLYICAALSGIYVLSASARITPHGDDDETMLITIEKGDTLWDLCQEHLKDPLRWRELSKYNDFTNPHLIYPGEKLRIPLAMAKDVVEIAEDELLKQQTELAELRGEFEKAAAMREELLAKVEALNRSMDELKSQLAELQKESAQNEEKFTDLQGDVEEKFTDLQGDVEEKFTDLQGDIQEATEKTEKEVKSVQTKLEAMDKQIASIQADTKTLLAQVEINQKAINEVKMILENAKGVHEEPSTGKRALVFLTTVAAGIGWFALNAIGGRSGE